MFKNWKMFNFLEIKCSVVVDMFSSVHCGSRSPPAATKHLKYG